MADSSLEELTHLEMNTILSSTIRAAIKQPATGVYGFAIPALLKGVYNQLWSHFSNALKTAPPRMFHFTCWNSICTLMKVVLT